MKTLRFIGMALLALVLCVNFTACSDDDDEPETVTDLIGTTWSGTNPYTDFGVEVYIKDGSKCVITVYRPDSKDVYDKEECSYVYDETTGVFSCRYDSYTITGKVEGNSMTLTDEYGTYVLKKK